MEILNKLIQVFHLFLFSNIIINTVAAFNLCGDKFLYKGAKYPKWNRQNLDNVSDNGYIVTNPNYTFECCGKLSEWKLYLKGEGQVKLQVWRPLDQPLNHDNQTFELVGQNLLTVTSYIMGEQQKFLIEKGQQISVQPGDVIGWTSVGSEMITYRSSRSPADLSHIVSNMPNLIPGEVFTLTTSPTVGRLYAIKAILTAGQAPIITNLPFEVKVRRNSPPGFRVFTVTATGFSTLQYSLVSQAAHSYFSINKSSGIIYIRSQLTSPDYRLIVQATNQCGLKTSSTLTVYTIIVNLAPVFHSLPAEVQIHEDMHLESLLHIINVTDPESHAVRCNMATTFPLHAPFFTKPVFPESDYGIYLKANTQLSYSISPFYLVHVNCTDGQDVSQSNLTIYLLHNQPPKIHNLPALIRISAKLTLAGKPVYKVTVTDKESDQLSFELSCIPETCPFTINSAGIVSTTEPLMSQTNPTFDVAVVVRDQRNTVGPRVLSVFLTALNVRPVLSSAPRIIYVQENTDIGSPVHRFSASDPDSAGLVVFSVIIFPNDGAGFFSLNKSTGVLSIQSHLDYESLSSHMYNLTVMAGDGIFNSKPLTVTILVVNVNEPPRFSSSVYHVTVKEGPKGSTFTPSFAVADPDFGDLHYFVLALDTNQGFFAIDSVSGNFTFAVDYDPRDLPSKVSLQTLVYDNGGLFSSTRVNITVQAMNKPLLIINLPWRVLVSEDTKVGSVLFTVNVSSYPDTPDSWKYKIDYFPPKSASKFFLNQSNGQLLLSESLDYETLNNKVFVLTIVVTDQFLLYSAADNLTLVLIDSNERPVFSSPLYNVSTFEGKKGDILASSLLQATDPDLLDMVHFAITGGSNGDLFTINSSSGDLLFAFTYNYNTMPHTALLDVTVFDQHGLSDTSHVAVTVLEVNKAPKLTNLPHMVYVAEDSKPGMLIYTVTATDSNNGDSVFFRAIYFPSSAALMFTMDPQTGCVTVSESRAINYEALIEKTIIAMVTASDGELESESVNVTVEILDVNESPWFSAHSYFITAAEGKCGAVLQTTLPMEVYDPDTNDTHWFTILPSSNSSLFTINAKTGEISFAVDFQLETMPSAINLLVAVHDKYGLQDNTVVKVKVLPVNKPPQLINLPWTVMVWENWTPAQDIFSVSSSDQDIGDVLYFRVNYYPPEGATGSLRLIQGQLLNYEQLSEPGFIVTVVVNDGREDSAPGNLTIKVVDLNEPPVFTRPVYYIDTTEGQQGTNLWTTPVLSAVDVDANDTVIYEIVTSNNSDLFMVNQTSGVLSLTVDYNCLIMPSHLILWVIARDQDGLTDQAEIKISIQPVNRTPRITNLPMTIRVLEGLLRSELLYTLDAFDPDSKDSLTFLVAITPLDGVEKFHIDSSSGAVILEAGEMLDYEWENIYVVTVTVYDGWSYSEPRNLTIEVMDRNEAPSFLVSRYFVLAEEGPAGKMIPRPNFLFEDADFDERTSFYISTGDNQWFNMDSVTGNISFAVNYDVDNGKMADTVNLEIFIKDSGGLYDMAIVVIAVLDVNDNSPVFSLPRYTIFISPDDPVATRLIKASATDADRGKNSAISYIIGYSAVSRSLGISESGEIYLAESLSIPPETVLSFNLSAVDNGKPQLSTVVTVTVLITRKPKHDMEAQRYRSSRNCPFDKPENLVWFSFLIILLAGAVFSGLLAVYQFTSCCCPKTNPDLKRFSPNSKVEQDQFSNDGISEISLKENELQQDSGCSSFRPGKSVIGYGKQFEFWNEGNNASRFTSSSLAVHTLTPVDSDFMHYHTHSNLRHTPIPW